LANQRMTPVKPRDRSVLIRQFIIDTVGKHPSDIAKIAAKHFGITPQAIQHHLNEMVGNGTLAPSGKTRNRRYELIPLVDYQVAIPIVPGLEEHLVWDEHIKPRLDDDIVPANVITIASYGFTEMFNNVIDHSGSPNAMVSCRLTAEELELRVTDVGIGIFKKIMDEMKLDNEVAAIHELVKGKLTTDPERHSGEGVFFTSRLFDYFSLLSGTLHFGHSSANGDWLIEEIQTKRQGTGVRMRIARQSKRHVTDVFHTYADPEKHDNAFSRTHVPLMLMQYGQDNLISRSQAKRLLNRFDRFNEIILDFQGVPFIGQAFADEVFRIFAKAHPDIEIIPIRANPHITGMIAHVTSPNPH
jgi:hypothetical protein